MKKYLIIGALSLAAVVLLGAVTQLSCDDLIDKYDDDDEDDYDCDEDIIDSCRRNIKCNNR